MAAAVAFLLAPTYTAKAQLLYEVEVGDAAVTDDSAGIDTLVEMLISPNHIRNLAASLAEDPGPAAPDPAETEDNHAAVAAEGDPDPAPVPDYEQLYEGLNAYRETKSRLIAVTFTSIDPQTAAVVANRAAQLYLNLEQKFQRERQARATGLIADRIPDAKDELDRAESALRAHQIEFGLSDAPGTDASDRQIANLNRQLGLTRSDLAQRQADLDRLRAAYDGARRQTDPSSPPESGKDPVDGVRLASGEAAAPPVSRATLRRITMDRDAAEARMRDIEERLSTLRRASAEQTDSWTHFRELEREAGAAGQVYESLLRRHDEMLGENGVRPSARLITTASLPDAPSSPNPLLFLAPAVVASLLLGGMLAILLERLDQRLRGERDVEEALGAPCIGLVPKVKRMRGATLLALLRDQPFSSFTEAIRGVFVAATRPSAQGEQPKIFLITSCAGGEGKSTLAVSMGTYGARLGRRVLMIDMDFRNPNLLKSLARPRRTACWKTRASGPTRQKLQSAWQGNRAWTIFSCRKRVSIRFRSSRATISRSS